MSTEPSAKSDFPRNAWYAAAWDREITRRLSPRVIANHPIVMYRKRNGECVALADACWHRLLPLSQGRLVDDQVVCGYHGLRYDASGRCVHMPSQETLNPSACVRSYPAVERHRFIWIWLGDPALADPARIPDLHWNADPAWASDGELIHVRCNYKLVLDNLMDLTHETFVHGSSIGDRSVAEAPFEVTHGHRGVVVARWMLDAEPPPFWARQLGKPGRVDRWQLIRFEPPCTIAIDVGVAPAGSGAPAGDRSHGVNGYVLNTVTPETDRSCHYFWAFARNYRLAEAHITEELRQGVAGIFAEDERILEAQQRAVDAHPDRAFYNLRIDAGAVWMRRIIDRLVAEEQP